MSGSNLVLNLKSSTNIGLDVSFINQDYNDELKATKIITIVLIDNNILLSAMNQNHLLNSLNNNTTKNLSNIAKEYAEDNVRNFTQSYISQEYFFYLLVLIILIIFSFFIFYFMKLNYSGSFVLIQLLLK